MAENTFYLRNIHENERELLFDLDHMQSLCMIATVKGFFEKQDREPNSVLIKYNEKAAQIPFKVDLNHLIYSLKTDFVNNMLSNEKAMHRFCTETREVPPMVHGGKKVYGFQTHSEMYIYYIGCILDQERSEFFIHCYDRQQLIELGYIENNQEV